MPKISPETIDLVKQTARIKEVVESRYPLKRVGSGYETRIYDQKVSINISKNIWKNWHTEEGGDPVKFVMVDDQVSYIEAISRLAIFYSIEIQYENQSKQVIPPRPAKKMPLPPKELPGVDEDPEIFHIAVRKGRTLLLEDPETKEERNPVPGKTKTPREPKAAVVNSQKTFRDIQLEESGLENSDQVILAYGWDSFRQKFILDRQVEQNIYEPATRDPQGAVVTGRSMDDMVIWYYGLDYKPVLYKRPRTERLYHFHRFRWQHPNVHLDQSGRPKKYESPAGGGVQLYIPEVVRKMYHNGVQSEFLFFHEGEKKADKACKHGMPSLGLGGIHSLEWKGDFPQTIIAILKKFQTRHCVFVMDSDFRDLSEKLSPKDPVDFRPKSFYRAVQNFKDYINQLNLENLNLQIHLVTINLK